MNGVAVIDLDAVARRLGFDKQMANAIRQRNASTNQQYATVKASYEKQIVEQQQAFGTTPQREQIQLLANMKKQADTNLNQARRQAKRDLVNHGAQLTQYFREQVKPIAREVANEKGFSVIVTKNDRVIFHHESSADITEAVIERMLARQSGSTATSLQPVVSNQ